MNIADVKLEHHGWYMPEMAEYWFAEAKRLQLSIRRLDWRVRSGASVPLLSWGARVYKLVDDGRYVLAQRVLKGEVDPLSIRVPLPPNVGAQDHRKCVRTWLLAAQGARLACSVFPDEVADRAVAGSYRGQVLCEGARYAVHLVNNRLLEVQPTGRT